MFNVIMGRRKAIILTSITILFLCSMGCQSATFGKGICCYVGDVKLSDTTISVKLTFDNDTTGTLEISKSNKALGKNKIEEFYFASLEADTLTLTGEIFYDIKYLFNSLLNLTFENLCFPIGILKSVLHFTIPNICICICVLFLK